VSRSRSVHTITMVVGSRHFRLGENRAPSRLYRQSDPIHKAHKPICKQEAATTTILIIIFEEKIYIIWALFEKYALRQPVYCGIAYRYAARLGLAFQASS
jgi:hypothetical protein